MKLIAGIADLGNKYKVVSTLKGDESLLFEFGGTRMYEIPSVQCFNAIEDALAKKKDVFIPKNITNPLTEKELIIEEATDLVKASKLAAAIQTKQFVSNRLGGLCMFDFFDFTILNNQLIAAGHVITTINREEVYLEVINSGDDKLINILEKYLEKLDKISEYEAIYRQWEVFATDLDSIKTESEVKTRVDAFYGSYN